MKQLIKNYYDIDVVGIIKLSSKAYKIKSNDCLYVVKIVENKNIEKVNEYIEVLHLKCFVKPYFNKYNEVITPYKNQYCYLLPYVDNSQGALKEMKVKFYFETLAHIHLQSFYYTKINHDYFETLHHDILLIIQEREIFYENMMKNFETIVYRSPSQWMFVMSYYRIYESLCHARQYLSQYLELTKSYSQVRVCLNYKHFDYDHISLKQQCLLSIDNICIDLPIYDLFDMYQRIPDILFDLDCFSQYYFQKIELKEDEKLLLCCLMNIVPLIYYGNDEIENIIKLSRLLYYLDSIQAFIQQI
ncbi:MAG: hypothetical protein K2P09_07540 [Erysipelotrichales bacterium]|nr:hypothetical protein [Erysipelotrichales bacterium]